MDKKEIETIQERVKLARKIILSGFFDKEEVTLICGWLGFCDTAFREKSSQEKLKDYLLDENYWKDKIFKEANND